MTKYVTQKNSQTTDKNTIEFTWNENIVWIRNLTLQKNLGSKIANTEDEFKKIVDSYRKYK